MRREISVSDLRVRFARFIRLAESGDEIVVRRRGLPIAVIVGITRDAARPSAVKRDWRSTLRAWVARPDRPRLSRAQLKQLQRDSRAGLP
jgi:prevent-host-death family protein